MITVLLKELWKLIRESLSNLKLNMGPASRLIAVLGAWASLVVGPVVRPKQIFELVRDTFNAWQADKAPQLAAGLAYYAVFALAPVLIIVIVIAGLVFEVDEVRERLVEQARETVGVEGADVIETTIENVLQPRSGQAAIVVSVITIVFGAIGAINHLQSSLNIIWKTNPGRRQLPIEKTIKSHVDRASLLSTKLFLTVLVAFIKALWHWVRGTVLSSVVVLVSGFLLIAFFVAQTLAAVLNNYLNEVSARVGLFDLGPLGQLLETIVSVTIISLLFAVIYRVLPDRRIPWSDVWVGAATTGILFMAGQYLISRYLADSGIESIYGAAGALIIVLVWVYYTAQIFLFGAELAKVYACKHGSMRPTVDAAGGRGVF
jgi:membrane protein